MTDTSKCLRAYAVGDEDVINGSVENYDFDWGEPVTTPDCRCTECSGCGSRCSCNCGNSCGCQNRCGCQGSCGCGACGCQNRCGNCCGCRNCCSCGDACVCTPEPEPEPDPDPVECTGSRCGCTASDEGAYPIIDL